MRGIKDLFVKIILLFIELSILTEHTHTWLNIKYEQISIT